ncbi:MAG: hypothetical protein CR955_01620 [Thiotrichales bacterium]|nr:MAG: hypothetical protein CR955_01620 [Thiotrichales bacterium]
MDMKAFKFEGSGFEYFKIWIVNFLLTIVTLGLYYPWAKVRTYRYFYANTTLEGRNFEYHATGKQLFLGYLIAVFLLIVFVVVQQVSPIGSLIFVLLAALAMPWVVWRSLKFRLRMSSFSNVRFGFDGSLGGAYMNFMVLPIATMVGLYLLMVIVVLAVASAGEFGSGLIAVIVALVVGIPLIYLGLYLFALVSRKKKDYVIGYSRFGQGKFVPNFETKALIKIFFKSFIVGLSIFAIYGLFIFLASSVSGLTAQMAGLRPEELPQVMLHSGMVLFMVLFYIGFLVTFILIYTYFYTRQRAYILANTTLDEEISFQSTLKARPYAILLLTNLLAVIFTLGLAMPWATVRTARFILENTKVSSDANFDVYLTQKSAEQSALAEEIGDTFDIDMGIGL